MKYDPQTPPHKLFFKIIYLTLIFLLLALSGEAQMIERQLIGSLSINNASACFGSSVGETMILAFTTNSITMSEGSHQGDETTGEPSLSLESFTDLTVYLNQFAYNGIRILEVSSHHAASIELDILTNAKWQTQAVDLPRSTKKPAPNVALVFEKFASY